MAVLDIESIKLDTDNLEFQQALQIVQYTRQSLFLTGKAGTGKSTFLRYVSKNTKKKHVILAPTGIAAINAGGQTLHSFFKLPFHPLLPDDSRYNARNLKKTLKYNGEKIKLLRELELIIIDEISMVRADIIDFIDLLLRVYCRNMREPFGGKQMLFVGDAYQLEPVVKDEERQLLHPYYPSAYFFDAHIFRQFALVSIELRKVYRQNDETFIRILDHIRTNRADSQDLSLINERVSDGTPKPKNENELAITLSARRDTVDHINTEELKKLSGEPTIYKGWIDGDFPLSNVPTPIELEVKVGAHVMFVKNDKDKRWVNGTLGIITTLDAEGSIITVVTEEGQEFDVERDTWENVRYTFNEQEKKIEEELLGTYHQFPLRLAWAITIHKSQGLTFSNVNIDLEGGAFAGGQTYVALSRCKSLQGITLSSPIRPRDIFVRQEVLNFASHYNDTTIIDRAMKQSQADKEYHDAMEAFNEGNFQNCIDHFIAAIHSRYDVEKPAAKRLIRRKLNVINLLRQEIEALHSKMQEREDYLRELSVEYVMMGKECEHEHFTDAAIKNYEKALHLCPDNVLAEKRLRKLKKKKSKE